MHGDADETGPAEPARVRHPRVRGSLRRFGTLICCALPLRGDPFRSR